MKTLQTIIFDFDGVLVDSVNVKGLAFAGLYRKEGPEIMARMLAYHNDHGGMPRRIKIQTFETDILKRPVSDDRIEHLTNAFAAEVEQQVIASPAIPGALEFLIMAYARLPLFVASATPQDELRRIVSARQMDMYFRGVFGSPVSKAEHIHHALQSQGLKPQGALMVGDALADFEAALKTGVHFVGVRAHGLERLFPDNIPIISTLHELPELLHTHFGWPS